MSTLSRVVRERHASSNPEDSAARVFQLESATASVRRGCQLQEDLVVDEN